MQTATLTKNYNIKIPKSLRIPLKQSGFESGQELQIIFFNDRIEFAPLKKNKDMRGILKGMDVNIIRDNSAT